ncbi:hypothetical protein [Actinomadura sp. HBU206391]|uniref:hypothetical protein n=1 Tax=Actinomadura sp. HBU206391 TaxID=2731692 RepID=UPI0021C6A805|nr:hypothetical protein [Actinomadura sp. HBU206391]
MSSADRLLLILHIGFAIFTLGPLTAATMASPRYIRLRQVAVLRYLNRATRIYGLLTLGIFLFGLLLADGDFAQVWLTASMTLFIVALVLLLIVERDQRKAVHALELAAAGRASAVRAPTAEPAVGEGAGAEKGAGQGAPAEEAPAGGTSETSAAQSADAQAADARVPDAQDADARVAEARATEARATDARVAEERAAGKEPAAAFEAPIAQVEQGRIAAISGVIALLWLVILFLMVWYSR